MFSRRELAATAHAVIDKGQFGKRLAAAVKPEVQAHGGCSAIDRPIGQVQPVHTAERSRRSSTYSPGRQGPYPVHGDFPPSEHRRARCRLQQVARYVNFAGIIELVVFQSVPNGVVEYLDIGE